MNGQRKQGSICKWFIYKYRRIKKEQRVSLGEEEMKHIRHAMIKVLMEEVRSLS